MPKLWIVLLAVLPAVSTAQHSKFNAGIVAGLNFSELEGEEITDYYGLNAGLIGTFRFSKHEQLGMEFLFSQNGEYILPESYPALQYGKVWLNHIEIPVHIDWLIGVFQRDKFYDWNLNLGIAYTRLIGFKAADVDKTDVSNQIIYGNKSAYLLQAGTTYHFTKKVGLNLKASLPVRVVGLNWTLAARMIYMLS
ncbi:MAG: outer membrane beta-barrel protein [Lewinellaceae bacterium]|nr:outer membrane beta-barrel protein [Lewinellaceae bacterium]